MKKIFYIGALLLATSLVSCNDLLDKYPLDTYTNSPAYWSNAKNLENQCNAFYNNYSGYGNWFYFKTLSDDQVAADGALDWTYTTVPTAASNWNDHFTEIRRANYIIQGVNELSTLEDKVKKPYEGIARLNRAWEYYQLVRKYGDVQWIDYVMDPADADHLYAERDDRDEVMDKVLEDLQFAVETIGGGRHDRFSSDMARAMLADVALYEGTYCKYRTAADNAGKGQDMGRSKKYLEICVKACDELMTAGYKLSESYKANYNSLDLSDNPEMIFFKPYEKDLMCHSVPNYTMNTSGTHGMTKDAFDSFLFLDGKPLATTSKDKNDAAKKEVIQVKNDKGELVDKVQYSLVDVLKVRDQRLSAILDPVLAIKGSPYSRYGCPDFTSTTGYGIAKYDNWDEMDTYERGNNGKQYTDAPLYWLSVIYLNYAEAKAELGTVTQGDLDKSVNQLQARAGLPGMTTSPAHDKANDMNVSDLLWEIRRCRRCELFCDNWYRYWDLVRWHQLDKLDSKKNPDIYLGANLENVEAPEVDIDKVSGKYMQGSNTLNLPRVYNSKYYFYPIPSGQLILNEKLKQNPGWEQ